MELRLRQTLQVPGEPVPSVHFPETGRASMLAALEDGGAAEVGVVGSEGMIGLPVLLDSDRDDVESMAQCPGAALRIGTAAFRGELGRTPAQRTLLLRYALVHHGRVARTAACTLARSSGTGAAADPLEQMLREEKATDEKLTALAEGEINPAALQQAA